MNRNEIVPDIDIINAVQDAMKRRGLFSKLKAQVRAEVYHILEDKTVSMPEKPPDIFVASELVKEFLSLLGLKNSLAVFCEEMGQPREMAVDRGVIGAELGLNTLGTEPSLPLLMMIVEHLKRTRLDYITQDDASIRGEANCTSDDEDEKKNAQLEREYQLFMQEQKIIQKQQQLEQQQRAFLQQQQNTFESRRHAMSDTTSNIENRTQQSDVRYSPKSASAPDSVTQPSDSKGDTIFSLVNKNRYREEENDRPAFDEDHDSYDDEQFDD
jgi:hypothetical protein